MEQLHKLREKGFKSCCSTKKDKTKRDEEDQIQVENIESGPLKTSDGNFKGLLSSNNEILVLFQFIRFG